MWKRQPCGAGRVYSSKVNHSHGNQAVCMVHRTAIHTAGRVYSISEKRYRQVNVLPLEFYRRPGFPFQIVFHGPTKSRSEPSGHRRTPSGSFESGISARPAWNLLQCRCDAVLRCAIYSRISFCITWSDIIFLTFPCSSCTWQNEGTEGLVNNSTQLDSTQQATADAGD